MPLSKCHNGNVKIVTINDSEIVISGKQIHWKSIAVLLNTITTRRTPGHRGAYRTTFGRAKLRLAPQNSSPLVRR